MLSADQRSRLRAALRTRPDEYVAQSEVSLSTAPVWNGQASEARPIVLRLYVSMSGDTGVVMPGGLTRVGGESDVPIVSMQRGSGSKDTWVVTEGPVITESLLTHPILTVRRERHDTVLPSRVALISASSICT